MNISISDIIIAKSEGMLTKEEAQFAIKKIINGQLGDTFDLDPEAVGAVKA